IDVRDGLAKVELRGSGESIVAMGEVHLIRVHGEDLRLGVTPLDLEGKQDFLGLTAEAAFAAVEKKIASELHGDGAGALGTPPLHEVAVSSAGDAREIDAPMILEVLIFNGANGVVENLGSLLPGHKNTALQGEAADECAIVGIDFRDHVWAIGFQGANFREVTFVDEEQAGGGAKGDGTEQQKRERHAVNQFPAA